jgi:hypothetical protein
LKKKKFTPKKHPGIVFFSISLNAVNDDRNGRDSNGCFYSISLRQGQAQESYGEEEKSEEKIIETLELGYFVRLFIRDSPLVDFGNIMALLNCEMLM